MTVVYEPKPTFAELGTAGAWQAESGVMRVAVAGHTTGRPTSVVWHPSGARYTYQTADIVWRVVTTDASGVQTITYVPFGSPTITTSVDVDDEGRHMRAVDAFGPGAHDDWTVEPNRLKHTIILDSIVVPENATHLVIRGRMALDKCEPSLANGKTAGAIYLITPEGNNVLTVTRPSVVDSVGNATHAVYEWTPNVDKPARTELNIAVDADWLRSAVGTVMIDPTVSTSTSSAATAYPNQRKLGRFSNGTLFGMFFDGSNMVARYSADGGSTWQTPTTGATIGAYTNGSVFIDPNDTSRFIHVVGISSKNIYYHRGTPTFDGSGNLTGISWSTAFAVTTAGLFNYSDLVVRPEGSGWKVHIISSYVNGTTNNYPVYHRVDVTAAGVFTVEVNALAVGANAGGSVDVYPSIASDPSGNLYVTWTTGATGTGKGIRFKKATYAVGPTWTWGTEEAVTEAAYALNMGPCGVDGNGKCYVAYRDAASPNYTKVFVRAAAGGWTDVSPTTLQGVWPTFSIDTNNNLWLFYVTFSPGDLRYRKYDGSTWSSDTVADSTTTCTNPSARRDTAGSAADVIYTTGSASPYTVKSFHLSLNVAPLEPTITVSTSSVDAAAGVGITIAHNDTAGDQMSAWVLKRVVNSVAAWWNASTKAFDQTSEYWNSPASGYSVTVAAADNAGKWTVDTTAQLYARTKDSSAVAGPYNTTPTQIYIGAKPNVAPSSPTTANSPNYVVAWTADRPTSAYQVTVMDGATPISDTGKVVAPNVTSRSVSLPTNSKTYAVSVTTWDQTTGGGVQGNPAPLNVTTSFTPPLTSQSVTATADAANARIVVTWARGVVGTNQNSTFGGTWYLYRKESTSSTWRVLAVIANPSSGSTVEYDDYTVAAGVSYDYRVDAIGSNGTTTQGTPVTASVSFVGVWVHDPNNAGSTLLQLRASTLDDAWTPQATLMQFAGRTSPVVEFGQGETSEFSLSLVLLQQESAYSSFVLLVKSKKTLCFRDGYGRKGFGVILTLPIREELWGGRTSSVKITSVDYNEFVA